MGDPIDFAKHAKQEKLAALKERGAIIHQYLYDHDESSTAFGVEVAFPDLASLTGIDVRKQYRRLSSWRFGSERDLEAVRKVSRLGLPNPGLLKAYDRAAQEIENAFHELAGDARSTRRKRVLSETGDDHSVDRALSGNAVTSYERKRGAKKKLVRICLQATNAAAVGERSYARRAALATAAAELFYRLGYAVEVTYAAKTWVPDRRSSCLGSARKARGGFDLIVTAPLKAPTQVIDPYAILCSGVQGIARSPVLEVYETIAPGESWNNAVKPIPEQLTEALGFDVLIDTWIRVANGLVEEQPVLTGVETKWGDWITGY